MLKTENTLSCAYITVGTGIGVGLVINGQSVKGLLHPEAGACPFHGACVEGMCASGSLAKRKGCLATELPTLPDDDETWDFSAYYIAQLVVSLILIASPEHIALGGGIFNRTCLYGKIRTYVSSLLNGYIQNENLTDPLKMEKYITASYWGLEAGLVGAVYLAQQAWDERKQE
eukprot:gene24506-30860_t